MEVEMRLLLASAFLLSVCAFAAGGSPVVSPASAAECTGENCPPPAGKSGHDCERKKQEQTTS
jgi:hypothetical protein